MHHNKSQRITRFAKAFDKRFRFPGTNIRFGWDAIIGLIPGIGDTLTATISSWLIYESYQIKLSFWKKLKMIWNIFLDWLIGIIPFFGDIFDIAWRANEKNAEILLEYIEKEQNYKI